MEFADEFHTLAHLYHDLNIAGRQARLVRTDITKVFHVDKPIILPSMKRQQHLQLADPDHVNVLFL